MTITAALINSPTISISSSPPCREPRPTVTSQARTPATGGTVRPDALLGLSAVGMALAMADPARAEAAAAMFLDGKPSNALSLPTWAVHVASVIERITAMGLVWQYGEVSGNKSWKDEIFLERGILGLMYLLAIPLWVPLLGGAFCACVWHFFYNSESLEVLVALQAAVTVLGNVTMCLAAFRIYRSSEDRSKKM